MKNRPTDEQFYRKPWMSDDQWRCFEMIRDLMGGFHHIEGKPKPFGKGIEWNTGQGGWATFDFSRLTLLVLMAHERAIRAEIGPSGPGMIKIMLHPRKREGLLYERHPTIEDVTARWRLSLRRYGLCPT